jgi:hypothetical protein
MPLRGAKRRPCALKRYDAQAWQSHHWEIASLTLAMTAPPTFYEAIILETS